MAIKIYREKIDQYIESMSDKDRKAMLILSAFLGILLIIYGLLLPAFDFKTQAKSHYAQEKALYQWLKAQSSLISAEPNNMVKREQSGSALTMVNASAKEFQLELKRVQPQSNGLLRVWLENANFDNALQWMENLNQQGQTISDLSIDRVTAGTVNLRATIVFRAAQY